MKQDVVLLLYTIWSYYFSLFFFFNDTATTEIYTLSLHDALPISGSGSCRSSVVRSCDCGAVLAAEWQDRKSTRLNSSHGYISYAVFCLKKKKKNIRRLCVECEFYIDIESTSLV